AQYYGWALRNRDHLLPAREMLEAAEREVARFRERAGDTMEILWVIPDYHAEFPKPCMNGWARMFLTVAPDGTALPCPAASVIPARPCTECQSKQGEASDANDGVSGSGICPVDLRLRAAGPGPRSAARARRADLAGPPRRERQCDRADGPAHAVHAARALQDPSRGSQPGAPEAGRQSGAGELDLAHRSQRGPGRLAGHRALPRRIQGERGAAAAGTAVQGGIADRAADDRFTSHGASATWRSRP